MYTNSDLSAQHIDTEGRQVNCMSIEDSYAIPRQLDENKGIFLCGDCHDVDLFERNGWLFGIDENNQTYGAMFLDTIIDNYYLADKGFNNTQFESAFEAYVLEKNDLPGFRDAGSEVEINGETITPDTIKKANKNPTDRLLFTNGKRVFIEN